jgi:hypothetical protein
VARRRRHSFFHLALMSLATSVLASCTGQWPQTSAVRPPPAPWGSPPHSASTRPAHKPNPPPAIDTPAPEAGGAAVAMTAPEPTTPATGPAAGLPPLASPPTQASELIGLEQPTARRLLGAAAEQFEQPPAMVWRYKTATCELDLFFYLDLRSGQMRTLHYSFKGDAADGARRRDCVRSLVAARGG